MASNKNQHFVPRCYLRSFASLESDSLISLYNIDRQKVIERAAIKHQCSGSYFYGKDAQLERAIQSVEGAYSTVLREIVGPGYVLSDDHRQLLRLFWLLQYLRTEAASKRSVEMTELTGQAIGPGAAELGFRVEIHEAVKLAMKVFSESVHVVSDLKVCLVKNRTRIPFVTSDDPAILTNRWYLEADKPRGRSFGMGSSGDLLLLPLSPKILCLAYDGDVYSVRHENGWVETNREADIAAFNEHQFLNCWANIYLQDSAHARRVHEAFMQVASRRLTQRHLVHYAVLDGIDGEHARYRVVPRSEAPDHRRAIIHTQGLHARPLTWPRMLSWRRKGFVFTNDSGAGFVRRAWISNRKGRPFRRELAQ